MSNIKPYKKLSEITDYDGNIYFTEATVDDMANIINVPDMKFLKVGDELMAVSSIKKISPHRITGFEALPKKDRVYMHNRITDFTKKMGEYPSEKQIRHWIRTEIT